MPDPSPYFSVVIPTYNRARQVAAAVASVLNQTFNDFEVIVVDDGSTDDTERVMAGIRDQRFFYHRKQNGERGAARNFGARLARGRYINYFDSDDLMYPVHLLHAKQMIGRWNEPEFFHLGYDFRTTRGDVVRTVDNFGDGIGDRVLFDNVLSCNGVLVRSDIAKQFPFEENRVLASAEDWELWIRLLSRFKLYYSNEVTTSVVGHDQRSIFTIKPEKVIERDKFLIASLRGDAQVMKTYGNRFRKFQAERFTFWMLCLSENGRTGGVLSTAIRAIMVYPLILTSRRFLASIRKILFGS
jgi:glycosyltransferase involved in cell wall biosynthesis